MVAVGETPGPLKGRHGGPADEDRQDVLDGSRPEREVLERVEPAMERLGRARPEVAPEPDRLVQVRPAHVETVAHRQVPELGRVPADADPGRDPAAAQRVERGQLLGEQDRVPLRDDDHARAEADAGMPAGEPGEGQDGLVDAPVLGLGRVGHDDVVGRPDRRPAEPLGHLGGGIESLGRRAVTKVGQAQAEVHRSMVAGPSRRHGAGVTRG